MSSVHKTYAGPSQQDNQPRRNVVIELIAENIRKRDAARLAASQEPPKSAIVSPDSTLNVSSIVVTPNSRFEKVAAGPSYYPVNINKYGFKRVQDSSTSDISSTSINNVSSSSVLYPTVCAGLVPTDTVFESSESTGLNWKPAVGTLCLDDTFQTSTPANAKTKKLKVKLTDVNVLNRIENEISFIQPKNILKEPTRRTETEWPARTTPTRTSRVPRTRNLLVKLTRIDKMVDPVDKRIEKDRIDIDNIVFRLKSSIVEGFKEPNQMLYIDLGKENVLAKRKHPDAVGANVVENPLESGNSSSIPMKKQKMQVLLSDCLKSKGATDQFATKRLTRRSLQTSGGVFESTRLEMELVKIQAAHETTWDQGINETQMNQDSVDQAGTSAEEYDVFKKPISQLVLKAGKNWRRSFYTTKKLNLSGQSHHMHAATMRAKPSERRLQSKVILHPDNVAINHNMSVLENYAVGPDNSLDDRDLTNIFVVNPISVTTRNVRKTLTSGAPGVTRNVTARDIVLMRCGQTAPLPFRKSYPKRAFKNSKKIGEGLYGEVFLFNNADTILKVIPVEGTGLVNGERQKTFQEVLSEIIISTELSNLSKETATTFVKVERVKCVKGRYPDWLIELWNLYAENHNSENDSPQMFDSNQLYIVLELAHGGNDLESFKFTSSLQAFAMFKQVAFALAVAEAKLHFEHRDLHWGNLLLMKTDKKSHAYRLDDETFEFDSDGIQATIIDFTLSRIEYDGVVIFNDLSLDAELFEAEGDYQFEVYRLMQQKNRNDWQHYEPYTNILWLHYLLGKVINDVGYKNPKSKVHSQFMKKLVALQADILNFNDCQQFVKKMLV